MEAILLENLLENLPFHILLWGGLFLVLFLHWRMKVQCAEWEERHQELKRILERVLNHVAEKPPSRKPQKTFMDPYRALALESWKAPPRAFWIEAEGTRALYVRSSVHETVRPSHNLERP